MYAKKERIYPAYVSKYNSNREKEIIHLMIRNGEKWYYLAIKKLSAISRWITFTHHVDFYCLNCLQTFVTEKNESHKKVCKNKDFFNVVMPYENTKRLEFNQYKKSDKVPFIIYTDLESIIEKIDVKIILKTYLE